MSSCLKRQTININAIYNNTVCNRNKNMAYCVYHYHMHSLYNICYYIIIVVCGNIDIQRTI